MKKNKDKKSKYNFDTKATYIIPMRSFKDRYYKDKEAVPTECNIKVTDTAVLVTTEGYKHYIFADYLFDWYLSTGYIKKKNV